MLYKIEMECFFGEGN